jgi:hypothetical protein
VPDVRDKPSRTFVFVGLGLSVVWTLAWLIFAAVVFLASR